MTRIALRNVSKTYPGSSRTSVDNVTLDIEGGEFYCLLGPSGCGKSTILRLIAGLETLTTGRITIGDRVVDDVATGRRVDAERRGLGLVFQNYALWPHRLVRDNIGFGPAMQKLSGAQRRQRVQEAMATLAIEDYADRYPSALSGGQQQRVAIARTLAARPAVLLLDEPLSNLDARLRLDMRAEFQRIHQQSGATMLFVTHDQFEAMTLATRIVVMDNGRVQQIGTPLDIYNRPVNRFVAEFMGNPPINMVDRAAGTPAARVVDLWLRRVGTDAATVGLRPEDLNIASAQGTLPPDALVIPLTVTALLPTGGSWIIELSDGARRLFATTVRVPQINAGDEVWAWTHTDTIHLFDSQGSRCALSGAAA